MAVTIYDINGKIINNISSFKENFVMFVCSSVCTIKVLNTETNNSRLITNDGELTIYNGNIITVFIDEVCDILVDGLPYRFTYKNTNIIPQHYETLIQNKNLPTHDEIFSCIVDRDKYMILGKLLLDYNQILKHKGKKLAITKFLNFIGFERVKLYEEFKTPTGKLSLIKNVNSQKTGNYHLILEHDYSSGGYTDKNLPELIRDDNSEDFIDIFWRAVELAKKYFMVPEQDISFFGITFQTNVGRFISNVSNTTAIHGINPSAYLNKKETFNINLFIDNPLGNEYLIENSLQTTNTIENRSVVFETITASDIFNNIFFVKNEDTSTVDPIALNTKFGTIIDLSVIAPKKYLEFNITHTTDPSITLSNGIYREYVDNEYHQKIFVHIPGVYKIVVDTYNEHNNRERFYYQFEISKFSNKIDIFYLNSTELIDLPENTNLDIRSSVETDSNETNKSPIHNSETIANILLNDITEYFNTLESLRFTDLGDDYVERHSDPKYKLDDFTTMPMDYIDNYLALSAYEVLNNVDTTVLTEELNDIGLNDKHIWVFMDIENEENQYMLLMNKQTGYGNEEIENENLLKFSSVNIPVNYDFDVPDFEHNYKSLYPRMTTNNNVLKLNDIFFARLDIKTVIGFKNVKWRIYNHITQELIHEHNGYSLKYRVINKGLFDIEFEFEINGIVNKIYKEKVFTSFGVTI